MSQTHKTNTAGKKVAVVIGATSKWQSDGRNTLLAHGKTVDDSHLPVGVRWGVGGDVPPITGKRVCATRNPIQFLVG